MLTRLLVASFMLVCTYAQGSKDNSISVNFNLPKECFEQESMNKRYAEVAGVYGIFFSFKLTPQCAHQLLEVSVTSINDETFSGFHFASSEAIVSDTLTFSCAMPTTIFTREGMDSTIFLNIRGESELPEVDREINFHFDTNELNYCQGE